MCVCVEPAFQKGHPPRPRPQQLMSPAAGLPGSAAQADTGASACLAVSLISKAQPLPEVSASSRTSAGKGLLPDLWLLSLLDRLLIAQKLLHACHALIL